MATVYITGKSSWEVELTYSTSFSSSTGKSTISFSRFRLRKGSSTTSASTTSNTHAYLIANGSSHDLGAFSLSVPKGGSWSSYYSISYSGSYTPGSSVKVGFDDPWNNLYGYNSGTKSITAAAYPTYTISYNANGGSGAPGSQTKTWGKNLTLSSTSPTRTNYQFLGWSTSSSATSATYSAGGTYTANAGATLYAVWKLLKPSFTKYPTVDMTETTLTYGAMTANISGTTFTYKIGDGAWQTAATSGATITDLTANTSYTITFRATANGLTTDYSVTKSTYNYPYITNFVAGTTNVGNSRTLEFYNPLKRSLIITAKVNDQTVLETESVTTTSASLSLIINAAAASIALGETSVSDTVTYEMTYGSISSIASETIQLTSGIGAPTVDSSKINNFITYIDSNNVSLAVTSSDEVLLQGYSKIKITPNNTTTNNPFTPLSPASIASYEIQINNGTAVPMSVGTSYYQGLNNTIVTNEEDSVAIASNINTLNVSIVATDTRGFSSVATRTIPITSYTKPTISIQSLFREDGYGSTAILSYANSWCPAFNEEAKSAGVITLLYKETSASASTQESSIVINNNPETLSNLFSSSTAYLARLRATDALGNSTYTEYVTIPLGDPLFFIDGYQNGVGINCFPSDSGLYVNDNAVITGDVSINGTLKTNEVNETSSIAVMNGTYQYQGDMQLNVTDSTSGTATQTLKSLLDIIYPIGCVYTSVVDQNPATLFGFGTWERIAQGSYLIGINENNSWFDTVGSTGSNGNSGSWSHKHTTQGHTLTLNEIPSHAGHLTGNAGGVSNQGNAVGKYLGTVTSGGTLSYGWNYSNNEYYPYNVSRGGGASHSHGDTGSTTAVSPFYAVYIWKRTA